MGSACKLHVAAVAIIMSLNAQSVSSAAEDMRSRVEAEFIERFTRFVQWPDAGQTADPSLPFVIGVIGDTPVRESLLKLEKGTIKGRPADVREVSSRAGAEACQVLFIAAVDEARLVEILSWTAKRPVLTISDTRGFAQRGVMINFFLDGDFIRFEINLEAARGSGLDIASELLALGVVLRKE